MNNNCSNLHLLSTIACQLSECLSREDLTILAADLTTLSDMLTSILARQNSLDTNAEDSTNCNTDDDSDMHETPCP